MIVTERLRLFPWDARHHAPFAAMQADPEVMADQGGPTTPAQNAAKIARYMDAYRTHGFCRWAVERRDGQFVGYAGVQPGWPDHPLEGACEIGWRLARAAWGFGYATEAAQAALAHFFALRPDPEVVAFTAADNLRSQAVMGRLGMRRAPDRDFTLRSEDAAPWTGLVWTADRPAAG